MTLLYINNQLIDLSTDNITILTNNSNYDFNIISDRSISFQLPYTSNNSNILQLSDINYFKEQKVYTTELHINNVVIKTLFLIVNEIKYNEYIQITLTNNIGLDNNITVLDLIQRYCPEDQWVCGNYPIGYTLPNNSKLNIYSPTYINGATSKILEDSNSLNSRSIIPFNSNFIYNVGSISINQILDLYTQYTKINFNYNFNLLSTRWLKCNRAYLCHSNNSGFYIDNDNNVKHISQNTKEPTNRYMSTYPIILKFDYTLSDLTDDYNNITQNYVTNYGYTMKNIKCIQDNNNHYPICTVVSSNRVQGDNLFNNTGILFNTTCRVSIKDSKGNNLKFLVENIENNNSKPLYNYNDLLNNSVYGPVEVQKGESIFGIYLPEHSSTSLNAHNFKDLVMNIDFQSVYNEDATWVDYGNDLVSGCKYYYSWSAPDISVTTIIKDLCILLGLYIIKTENSVQLVEYNQFNKVEYQLDKQLLEDEVIRLDYSNNDNQLNIRTTHSNGSVLPPIRQGNEITNLYKSIDSDPSTNLYTIYNKKSYTTTLTIPKFYARERLSYWQNLYQIVDDIDFKLNYTYGTIDTTDSKRIIFFRSILNSNTTLIDTPDNDALTIYSAAHRHIATYGSYGQWSTLYGSLKNDIVLLTADLMTNIQNNSWSYFVNNDVMYNNRDYSRLLYLQQRYIFKPDLIVFRPQSLDFYITPNVTVDLYTTYNRFIIDNISNLILYYKQYKLLPISINYDDEVLNIQCSLLFE